MWTALHTKGDKPCGKPALKAIRKPMETDYITPDLIRNIDGSIPKVTDPVICQTCGGNLWGLHADDFIKDAE